MKKVVSIKEIMIILISLLLIIVSTEVFAVQPDLVLGSGNNNSPQTVTPDEYADAQKPDVVNPGNNAANGNSATGNNTNGNNTNGNNTNGNNTKGNNTKVYNTNNTDLPQTGIEDYNIGILLIICVASAIYAYRKINDYKNI